MVTVTAAGELVPATEITILFATDLSIVIVVAGLDWSEPEFLRLLIWMTL